MLDSGTTFRSPGGSFAYVVQGPVCRLYDRDELPWPCCRLQWKGKEPSWNRVGRRFVADLGSNRFPSYSVMGIDRQGNTWEAVQTDPTYPLSKAEKAWWYAKTPAPGYGYPERP